MSYTPKILAFAGSLRVESYNKKLVKIAQAGAEAAGASVTYIDLRDYPLPIFDEDFESENGLPENGRKLKDLFITHDGLLIASPEYNSSMSAAFKNTIDWVSRPVEGQPPFECFIDKVAAIMATSPGALGGLRGLVHVRSLLGNIKVTVLPEQVAVPSAAKAFDQQGRLSDSGRQTAVKALGKNLAHTIAKLRS